MLQVKVNRPGFAGDPDVGEIGVMSKRKKYSAGVRERAVRMALEQEGTYRSEWATIESIAKNTGCASETLRNWVRWAERDAVKRPGPASEELARINKLERKVQELRRAN